GLTCHPCHESPGIEVCWLIGVILKGHKVIAKLFAAAGQGDNIVWLFVQWCDEGSKFKGMTIIHDRRFRWLIHQPYYHIRLTSQPYARYNVCMNDHGFTDSQAAAWTNYQRMRTRLTGRLNRELAHKTGLSEA